MVEAGQAREWLFEGDKQVRVQGGHSPDSKKHRQAGDRVAQVRPEQVDVAGAGHQQAPIGVGIQVQEDDEGEANECQVEEEKEVRME